MLKKIVKIIKDFFKSNTRKEKFELIGMPIISIFILAYFTYNSLTNEFIANIIDDIITISSLLIAFGLSSTTTLFSTNNNTTDKAKEFITDRKSSNGNIISYFQLIQIRSYYSIICEISLIIISFTTKILIQLLPVYIANIIFYCILLLLIHTLFVLLTCVLHMYYLSFKDR